MHRTLLLLLVFLLSLGTQAQSFRVGNPLPLAPALSGNFGELRPNHFHAGIDLKTGGQEGLEVTAVADGFVSRIKISPYGYGKVLYIDHPNGYTTVYAHLQSFAPHIEAYVQRYQRIQKSFEIELFPGQDALVVKQGEVVAFSGNTGGSGGPHLHFEVRETKSEVPRNPLLYDFPVADRKPPVLQSVGIAPLTPTATVNAKNQTLRARVSGTSLGTGTITISGTFGIELQGYDSQEGSLNQNGIYHVALMVNGEPFGHFVADSIPFDVSRHLNALIDYPYYYSSKQRFMRLYRLPGNQLPNLKMLHDGKINLPPGAHKIQLTAADVAGNKSIVSFDVEVLPEAEAAASLPKDAEMIRWNVPFIYESDHVRLYFPSLTVYDDVPFVFSEKPSSANYSVSILTPFVPVQSPFEISLNIPADCPRKGLLICQTNAAGARSRPLASRINEDWISAESKSFGQFSLTHDTKAPEITSINVSNNATITTGLLKFKVTDDFSGIERYNAWLNNEWVVMEYEPKQDLMFIHVNALPTNPEMQLLRIEITDMAGNVATFERTLLHP